MGLEFRLVCGLKSGFDRCLGIPQLHTLKQHQLESVAISMNDCDP